MRQAEAFAALCVMHRKRFAGACLSLGGVMRAVSGIILCAAMVVALSACSTTGSYQSSVSFNGFAAPSVNLRDPHYYMDDDGPFLPAHSTSEYRYLLSNPNNN
jgi:hypothetical protein